MKKLLAASALAVLAAASAVAQDKPKASTPADVTAKIVGVEYKGTKMWLPGIVFAKKGDRVRIEIINKIAGEGATPHGLAVDVFGVKETLAPDETKTIEFKASEAGIFPLYCHLHPAHVGGQLVVLDK